MRRRTPAIFLDRDGVLNRNRSDYVKCWDEFELLPRATDALQRLAKFGVPIVIVTNQAGINRGIMARKLVDDIHRRMIEHFRHVDVHIAGVFCCPHQSSEGCDCRKPQPGMLLTAAEELDIDLPGSVLVGDALTDIIAGRRANCRTILVLTGRGWESLQLLANGTEPQLPHHVASPDAIASDLATAVPLLADMLRYRNSLYTVPSIHNVDVPMTIASSAFSPVEA